MWRPLETARMIEKSILMPVFFFSFFLFSPFLPLMLSLPSLLLEKLSTTHLHRRNSESKDMKVPEQPSPHFKQPLSRAASLLSCCCCCCCFPARRKEGVASPKSRSWGWALQHQPGCHRLQWCCANMLSYTEHPPAHTHFFLLLIFQSSSLLGAPRCDCSLLGVQRRTALSDFGGFFWSF